MRFPLSFNTGASVLLIASTSLDPGKSVSDE